MILGSSISKNPPDPLVIDGNQIDRVHEFKLLGVHISNDLRWDSHIDAICSRANSRLYFLKQLKRAGLTADDLICFYTTVIRPVLEYACVVWHHGLTKALTERLESLQKRAIHIIHPVTWGMPYSNALLYSDLQSLFDRRHDLGKKFFDKICQESNCIHHLLPPKRDSEILSKLRNPHPYPHPKTRTSRYTSYINYALSHYQH